MPTIAAPAAVSAPVAASASAPAAGPPSVPLVVRARGASLVAHHHAPPGRARGAVLIAPAMAVPQRFYEPLAGWLAGAGFHALTFDYRGTGASLTGRMRDVDADVVTWAEQDMGAALRQLESLAPGLPVTWLGHSLGGQVTPLVPGADRVARIITIATGSGYWRQNAAPLRRKVWLFWFAAVPLLTPLFGYFPGKPLGMVGNLPRGVIRQWRRWCLDPEYCVGAEGPDMREQFSALRTPITSLSFTDDEMMSDASIAALHALFTGAPKRMLRLSPADAGLRRIGHFGFFRPASRAPLWERFLAPELVTS